MLRISVPQAVAFATNLFTAADADDYPNRLVDSLKQFVPFDFFAVVHFPRRGGPVFRSDNLATITPPKVLSDYKNGTYLLDPVYAACRYGRQSGLYRLTDLAPDEYFKSAYYNSANMHLCISDKEGSLAEEIAYIARCPDESCMVFSLMRDKQHKAFSEQDFAKLADFEPAIRETLVKYWARSRSSQTSGESGPRPPSDGLEQAFSEFAKDKLSSREQSVVSLLLRGHSTMSVAENLCIAQGTVKIHRKHIYRKLRISSHVELFIMFCNQILSDRG